jgi:hypothetical protein
MPWRRIFREAEAMDAAQIPDWIKRNEGPGRSIRLRKNAPLLSVWTRPAGEESHSAHFREHTRFFVVRQKEWRTPQNDSAYEFFRSLL